MKETNISYKSTKSIIINGNQIIIDGVDVTPDSKIVNIYITGNVETIDVTSCNDFIVNGNVTKLKTTSGDIKCGNVLGDIKTTSGNVKCGDVTGNISTISGNVTIEHHFSETFVEIFNGSTTINISINRFTTR